MPPANNNFITDGLHSHNLEPRVAKLETGLEILTRDVSNLVVVVRDQSRNIEGEIQKLVVAVTQAAAPKKTEWSTLIAMVMLIMALGSTAFIPLRQMEQTNNEHIREFKVKLDEHTLLESHPVASAELSAAKVRFEIITEQIKSKLNKLESNNEDRNKADLDELREIKKRVVGYHMGPMPYTVVTNR